MRNIYDLVNSYFNNNEEVSENKDRFFQIRQKPALKRSEEYFKNNIFNLDMIIRYNKD